MRLIKIQKIFPVLSSLFFLAPQAFASETRVDSAGGLSLVLNDESAELKPILFGNPAGLSFLDSKNRFDWAAQWFVQNSAATSRTDQFYGTLSDPLSNAAPYHGLILEPVKNWALQLDADLFHSENQPDVDVQNHTRDRTREFLKTSVKMGSLAIGGSVQATQVSSLLEPGDYYGARLESGQRTGSGLAGTGGLLISFPPAPLAQQARFILGGVYSREIIPGQSQTGLVLEIPGPVTLNLSQTARSGNSQSFGPEFYFEVPNSLQAVLLGRLSNGDVSLEQDSSNPMVPNQSFYRVRGTTETTVLAALKTNSPLQKLTSLKSGFSFLYQSSAVTSYDPSETLTSTFNNQAWQLQAGTGLEGLEKYTVGLQLKLQGANGGLTPASGPIQPFQFFSYQINLGGEQWLSKQWAFRAGIAYENDLNTGAFPYLSGFFPIPGGQRIVAAAITTGVGYKTSNFKSDLLFLLSQPSVYDSPNPDDFMTRVGLQWSASILFE